ncbi:MAG: DUF2520 domain-containing protein [Bacteroidales bacterium]|nr:DUF2520 domain-containing protein [Bacteroidales bacterium]
MNKISFIGSGRLATSLALGFHDAGAKIVQVYSQHFDHAKQLAERVGAEPLTNLQELSPSTDLIVIAISDSAIEEVAAAIPFTNVPVVHTAGAVSSSVLRRFSRAGVIYAPQTFSKTHKVNMAETPFFIEGNSSELASELDALLSRLSGKVGFADSQIRLRIHLAAVFANNFTNHLLAIAQDILHQENIPFDILMPIIRETLHKIETMNPSEAQTGPAIREDYQVIEKHLQVLENHPEYHQLYSLISESIIKQKQSKNGTF